MCYSVCRSHQDAREGHGPFERATNLPGLAGQPVVLPCGEALMDQREARRDRTIRIGTRRQHLHLVVVHRGDLSQLDCICERSPWRFAKRKAWGCNCRRRPSGSPHYGAGICYGRMGLRPAVRARRAWRRQQHLWQARLVADDRFDRGEV